MIMMKGSLHFTNRVYDRASREYRFQHQAEIHSSEFVILPERSLQLGFDAQKAFHFEALELSYVSIFNRSWMIQTRGHEPELGDDIQRQ